ncbi:MAG: type IV toxin-antitoxin system AbiEi family antitoxin domain-containing protein [Pseudonocardiaceae bacterium]
MDYEIEMADIAAGQWGLITSRQALDIGATSNALTRLAAQGALERVTYGVYRIGGTPSSPLDGLRADWLALDPSVLASDRLWGGLDLGEPLAIVSHRSAARLHDFGDIDADDHEFTLPVRKQTRRAGVRIHRFPIEEDDWTVVGGLPVTTPVRTIDDLAAVRLDGGHLASIVRDALAAGSADDEEVIRVLRQHARFYGAPMGNGTELLKFFLQEAGVPKSAIRMAELASGSSWSVDSAPLPISPDVQTGAQLALRRMLAENLAMSQPDLKRMLANNAVAAMPDFKQLLANQLASFEPDLIQLFDNMSKASLRNALTPLIETAFREFAFIEVAQSLEPVIRANAATLAADISANLRNSSQPAAEEKTAKETMKPPVRAIAAAEDDSTTAAPATATGDNVDTKDEQ